MREVVNASEASTVVSSCYPDVRVIGVDGLDGVGKSPFAKALARSLGGTVISLDDFIARNRGGYVPFLREDQLNESIGSASRPAIVEGICLRAALERIGVRPDVLIYIKRVADSGFWYDQDTCDPEEEEEALIARLAEETAAVAKLIIPSSVSLHSDTSAFGLSSLREEIIRYHCRYRPSRRAGIVVLRPAQATS